MLIRLARYVVLLSLAGCQKADQAPTAPAPSAAASPPVTAAPPNAAPDAGCDAPPDDSRENPWCAPAVEPAAYGAFRPKPEEVLAALAKMKHSHGSGWLTRMGEADGWLAVIVHDCMHRLRSPYVQVMRGVMSGETPSANVFSTGSVEWNGRRFITLSNFERYRGGFMRTSEAVELTPRGPVQLIEDCQEYPGATQGHAAPGWWSAFPEEVRARLCP